jgi:ribosomal protein L39E
MLEIKVTQLPSKSSCFSKCTKTDFILETKTTKHSIKLQREENDDDQVPFWMIIKKLDTVTAPL